MGIGYRELLVLLFLMGLMVLVVAGIIWVLIRVFRNSAHATTRPAAERLAELESLRKAEQITASEYEKRRAQILASI